MILTILNGFSLADVLDILMVALIIFFIFRWIRGTSAMNIFLAIAALFIVQYVMDKLLHMSLMTQIMKKLTDVGIVALIVIFQPEIRHFLNRIGGSEGLAGRGRRVIDRLFGVKTSRLGDNSVTELVEAVKIMAEQKTGALIIIRRKDQMAQVVETGDNIDALVSRRLLLNLFFKNSPLHDGAVIIDGDRIVAARCTLPLTGKTDIPARYGMRHKAAIGISEECDALVVVVSEETGGVSFVKEGVIRPVSDIAMLREYLTENSEGKTSDG